MEHVEEKYRDGGMLTRMVGAHQVNSLFVFRLKPGELMWSAAFRSPERYSPPQGSRGCGVWGQLLFFVLFPFSRCACDALYGWAWDLQAAYGAPALLPALPLMAPLLLLQAASTLAAALSLASFSLFGSLYAMAAFGDTKITLRWLQNLPHLVIQAVNFYYFPPAFAQVLTTAASVAMMAKGLSGDVLHSLKVWWDEKETRFDTDDFVDADPVMMDFFSAPKRPQPQMAQLKAPEALPGMSSSRRSSESGRLPPALTAGAPVDTDPCVCIGAPLHPCGGAEDAECGSSLLGAAGCCVPGRRSYSDALTYMYGALTFREALWALTGAPLITMAVFAAPVLNFATIPAFFALSGRLDALRRPWALTQPAAVVLAAAKFKARLAGKRGNSAAASQPAAAPDAAEERGDGLRPHPAPSVLRGGAGKVVPIVDRQQPAAGGRGAGKVHPAHVSGDDEEQPLPPGVGGLGASAIAVAAASFAMAAAGLGAGD